MNKKTMTIIALAVVLALGVGSLAACHDKPEHNPERFHRMLENRLDIALDDIDATDEQRDQIVYRIKAHMDR